MKYLIPGLMALFASVVCLVSWVSECHMDIRPGGHVFTPQWAIMDPPLMSLYLSVPGFFVCLVLAFCCIGKGINDL